MHLVDKKSNAKHSKESEDPNKPKTNQTEPKQTKNRHHKEDPQRPNTHNATTTQPTREPNRNTPCFERYQVKRSRSEVGPVQTNSLELQATLSEEGLRRSQRHPLPGTANYRQLTKQCSSLHSFSRHRMSKCSTAHTMFSVRRSTLFPPSDDDPGAAAREGMAIFKACRKTSTRISPSCRTRNHLSRGQEKYHVLWGNPSP